MNFIVIFLSEKGIDISYTCTISVSDIKRVKKGDISKFEKEGFKFQHFVFLS